MIALEKVENTEFVPMPMGNDEAFVIFDKFSNFFCLMDTDPPCPKKNFVDSKKKIGGQLAKHDQLLTAFIFSVRTGRTSKRSPTIP